MMLKKTSNIVQNQQAAPPIGKYINLKTDFSFKYAFGVNARKKFTISFINSIFQGRKVIKDLSFSDPSHKGMRRGNRKTVFDIYCTCTNGEKIIVEIQQIGRRFFKERIIYYVSKLIEEQGDFVAADWNYCLPQVHVIAIMNFCFDDSHSDCYLHDVRLIDINTNTEFYDKLSYMFIELPKFKKSETELERQIDKWLYSIKNMENLTQIPLSLTKDEVFNDFYKLTETANLNPEEMTAYEYALKIHRDNYSAQETAEWRGAEKERAKNTKVIAKAESDLAKVRKEKREMAITTARKLKKNDVAIELIADATGLTIAKIEKL